MTGARQQASVPLLDELIANAWPPTEEERRGRWRYRWAAGVTRRANSALAFGSDEDYEDLVDGAEAFYVHRGATVIFQVSTASAPPGLDRYLSELGYRRTGRTLVECADTVDVVGPGCGHVEVYLSDAPTEEWLHSHWSIEGHRGRRDGDRMVFRDTLLKPPLPMLFATARSGTAVSGVGQLVLERGWGGVQCMATTPDQRGRGVARAVLSRLAEAAIQRGVESMYLPVQADNAAAIALYERAGFVTSHEYCYFTKPD